MNYQLRIKLCDLGIAKVNELNSQLVTTQGKKRTIGTPLYMAPEILLFQNEATEFSDMWSLSCTIVECYNNSSVWKLEEYDNPYDQFQTFLKTESVPDLTNVPKYLEEIIEKGFSYKENSRPFAKDILAKFDEYRATL